MAADLLGYTACRQLSQLLATMAFFHGSEYALAIAFHGRSNVSLNSLLISKQYVMAMTCALLEYALEITMFPELKEKWMLSNTGIVMILVGELIRKAGVITAGRAFTHSIRIYYEEHHRLVTHGIYRFIRHPGYSGFFIWATGTQVMLCNPICIVCFTAVTWRFFYLRIPYPLVDSLIHIDVKFQPHMTRSLLVCPSSSDIVDRLLSKLSIRGSQDGIKISERNRNLDRFMTTLKAVRQKIECQRSRHR